MTVSDNFYIGTGPTDLYDFFPLSYWIQAILAMIHIGEERGAEGIDHLTMGMETKTLNLVPLQR